MPLLDHPGGRRDVDREHHSAPSAGRPLGASERLGRTHSCGCAERECVWGVDDAGAWRRVALGGDEHGTEAQPFSIAASARSSMSVHCSFSS